MTSIEQEHAEARHITRRARFVVQTEKLPSNGSEHPAWARMGVIVGDIIEDDRCFRHVALPRGWGIVPAHTDLYWNWLCDAHLNMRGEIYYHAHPCHADTQIRPLQRYYPGPRALAPEGGWVGHVYDYQGVQPRNRYKPPSIFETDAMDGRRFDKIGRSLCITWLDEHYPDWEDPAAYWEDSN